MMRALSSMTSTVSRILGRCGGAYSDCGLGKGEAAGVEIQTARAAALVREAREAGAPFRPSAPLSVVLNQLLASPNSWLLVLKTPRHLFL